MSVLGKRAALYLYAPGENALEPGALLDGYAYMRKRAMAYCVEHGYHLDNQHIYKDIDQARPALTWLRDAMNDLEFHLLLLPSFPHIHEHMGHVLNFLQETQDCQVDVVCLDPIPTHLCELGLPVVSLTQKQAMVETVSLSEIIRVLRYR